MILTQFNPSHLNPSGWWDCTIQNDNSAMIVPHKGTGLTDIANSFSAPIGTDNYRREWQFDGTQAIGSAFLAGTSGQVQNIVTGDTTVFIRFKFNSIASANQLCAYTSGTSTWGILYNNGTGNLSFRANFGGTSAGGDVTWSPSTGVWYNMTVTRTGNNLQIFIDGVSQSITYLNQTSIGTNCSSQPVSSLGILHRQTTTPSQVQPTDGDLDSFFIKNAVLSQNEIDLLNNYYGF